MIGQKRPGAEARAGRFPGPSLIPDLHAIQREHGWLPREELVTLSRERRRPLYEIEGLISFYPHFLTAPPEATEVTCCHDLSCWLRGSDEVVAACRERIPNAVMLSSKVTSSRYAAWLLPFSPRRSTSLLRISQPDWPPPIGATWTLRKVCETWLPLPPP